MLMRRGPVRILLGECRVEHLRTGATVATDLPPEFGGEGKSFSATDLLAAALGVCVATSIDRVADRGGIPPEALRVEVEKELSTSPNRVARLSVWIYSARPVDAVLRTKLLRAALAESRPSRQWGADHCASCHANEMAAMTRSQAAGSTPRR